MKDSEHGKLRCGAYFSDIHFGKKSNSTQHNEDCLKFIDWFCEQVKSNPEIDYVAFLGDWNENRSALNIATMKFSFIGAKKLNDLGIPVYFVVGNHDLYHRHTREVHSVLPFQEFSNFKLIDHPIVVEEIYGNVFFSPFLFHDEYPKVTKHLNVPFWAGHFEFKDFLVTGYGMKMPTGPDALDFSGPKHIVSGHFHKRQASSNIVYIGNAFPMDFGDAGDNERGMMVYHHERDEMSFINWGECPKYIRTTLTDMLDGTTTIYQEARVKCIADVSVSYEEAVFIKEKYVADYNLREFVLEESNDLQQALENTDVDEIEALLEDEELVGASIDELVVAMLKSIDTDKIDNDLLIAQYSRLKL